ncbi:hypothetical protein TNCV_2305581 [Trichonephila clavipes]|nr:hypothetical protein TNCV_2305581 [Trichonephila clavipes]
MVLKANDRRTSCPCHDEFRGPRSDYVRQICRDQWCNGELLGPTPAKSALFGNLDVIYTATRLRTPSTDQSSRNRHIIQHALIRRYPDSGHTFTTDSSVFSNHCKVSGGRTFGITAPITCNVHHTHSSTPPFGVVSRTMGLDCNGMKPGHLQQ